MHIVLSSWAPTGLVRAEHMAFMGELAADFYVNDIDVSFHCDCSPVAYDSYSRSRSRAAVRQADLLFRMHWNAWGPLGPKDKAVYMAAFRAMFSQIPGQDKIPQEECDIVKRKLGDIDAIVFQTPFLGSMFLPPWEGSPFVKLGFGNDIAIDIEDAPMALMRLGTDLSIIVGASVPVMMFDPEKSQVLSVNPQYSE